MKFVEVKEIPKTFWRSGYEAGKVQNFCMEFLESGIKIAKVDYGKEYPNVINARSSIAITCKKYGFPIQTIVRNGELYLMRKD